MQCLLPPVLLMLISTVTVADDSCRSECHEDRMPQCGVWLMKETNPDVAGTYEVSFPGAWIPCAFRFLL
ncbi:unnamed protein product [Heligmosomoides polygyrus]|uniref:Secreted protein n=1 Tax=Heligmosomoides polygyrus TaxID=6339 RepID=A0A183F7T9_HELPZ|nr:unnamed protein product [Heligmosomoides polygyrus]